MTAPHPLTYAVVDPDGSLRVESTPARYGAGLLEVLQTAVGGYLEYVPTGSRDLVAYVDEEGVRHGHPANPVGTLVLAALGARAQHAAGWLLGPLVLCGSRGPAEVSLRADQLDRIRAACAEAVVTIYRTHHPAPSGPASA